MSEVLWELVMTLGLWQSEHCDDVEFLSLREVNDSVIECMRVCNRVSLHHGDLLIYSQTSVISRGSQRL